MLRRHFLRLLAAPVILPFLPGGRAFALGDQAFAPGIDEASRRLAGLLPGKGAREIGARALACGACEPDARRLATSLVETLPDSADRASPDALRRAVDMRIRTDFAESRTVLVDGWVLSLTEVRLCALRTIVRT